jgi:hypothetical protein
MPFKDSRLIDGVSTENKYTANMLALFFCGHKNGSQREAAESVIQLPKRRILLSL